MRPNEMYKVKNGPSPEIMNEIFQLREDNYYSLRKCISV